MKKDKSLNDEQNLAVYSRDHLILVSAPAGSGSSPDTGAVCFGSGPGFRWHFPHTAIFSVRDCPTDPALSAGCARSPALPRPGSRPHPAAGSCFDHRRWSAGPGSGAKAGW